jgi:hypothetical protein
MWPKISHYVCFVILHKCTACASDNTTQLRQQFSFSPWVSKPQPASTSVSCKVNVKCTLVQALRLCTDRTAYRKSRGITLPFHDHGTRRGRGVSVTPRPLFTPGKDPVPIVQEAGWSPGSVWTGAENLASTENGSPDRPACSQSLYRLSYPVHQFSIALLWLLFKMTSHAHSDASKKRIAWEDRCRSERIGVL